MLPLSAILTVTTLSIAAPLELDLWDGNPPDVVTNAGRGEDDGTGRIVRVGLPSLEVHFPPQEPHQDRPVLIVCPGGGYHRLAAVASGNGAVKAFLPRDVVVVVLKYRTNPPCTDVGKDALADAHRAVRLVRHRAGQWTIDPHKVGVVGWSAGANLTLNLATHWDLGNPSATDPVDRQSCRPDVVAMLCPWPWNKSIRNYPISSTSPPAFIASAKDDRTAPTSFALAIADGYQKAKVNSFLWLVESGGHTAFSVSSTGEGSQWSKHFWQWLQWPAPFHP